MATGVAISGPYFVTLYWWHLVYFLITREKYCEDKYISDDSLLESYGLFNEYYRLGTVNSKSFVGKVLLQIKQKFELIYAL